MTNLSKDEQIIHLAQKRFNSDEVKLDVPFTVLASPAWRGVESNVWCVKAGDKTELWKSYHDDTKFYINTKSAIESASMAGDVGAGPKVHEQWPDLDTFAMEYLGQGWRVCGLHDAYDKDIRSNIINAKRLIQNGPELPESKNIFNEIRSLKAFCDNNNVILPASIDSYMQFVENAESAITAKGFDNAPCHREGNTSNIMLGPDKKILLIDYDLAGNCDPYEDAGCFLGEMFESDPEARAGFEEWFGHFDEGLFQRCMLYSILDDLRWGLIGLGLAFTSSRTNEEFGKYSSWRFLRFESKSLTSAAFDRIRAIN